eukprot:m.810454 g.810454  ORF g.810454 m.810454 type:complete len:50 (+) comp59325_c0_seq6:323-472(+)
MNFTHYTTWNLAVELHAAIGKILVLVCAALVFALRFLACLPRLPEIQAP